MKNFISNMEKLCKRNLKKWKKKKKPKTHERSTAASLRFPGSCLGVPGEGGTGTEILGLGIGFTSLDSLPGVPTPLKSTAETWVWASTSSTESSLISWFHNGEGTVNIFQQFFL